MAGKEETASGGSAPLGRAAQVIDIVAGTPGGLPLNRIAEEAGLPPSTTHRLLRSLLSIGYLAVDEGRRTYRLGRRLIRVFHAAFGPPNVEAVAEPILARLVETFGQVFFVNQLVAGRAKLAAFAVPSGAPRSLVVPGEFSPIHATAAGKAIFAFEDEAMIERALSQPLEKYQPATMTDPDAIRRELALVRERGYALSQSEFDAGVTALAVPVAVEGIGVTYAIGTAGIETSFFERHSLEQYVAAMTLAAQDLRAHLVAEAAG